MTQTQADIIDYIIIEGDATAEEIADWLRLDVEQVEAELEGLRLDGQIIEDGFEETPSTTSPALHIASLCSSTPAAPSHASSRR
jgi:hypothetical protein